MLSSVNPKHFNCIAREEVAVLPRVSPHDCVLVKEYETLGLYHFPSGRKVGRIELEQGTLDRFTYEPSSSLAVYTPAFDARFINTVLIERCLQEGNGNRQINVLEVQNRVSNVALSAHHRSLTVGFQSNTHVYYATDGGYSQTLKMSFPHRDTRSGSSKFWSVNGLVRANHSGGLFNWDMRQPPAHPASFFCFSRTPALVHDIHPAENGHEFYISYGALSNVYRWKKKDSRLVVFDARLNGPVREFHWCPSPNPKRDMFSDFDVEESGTGGLVVARGNGVLGVWDARFGGRPVSLLKSPVNYGTPSALKFIGWNGKGESTDPGICDVRSGQMFFYETGANARK